MKMLITVVLLALMGGALVGWAIHESTVSPEVVSLNANPLSSIELTDHDNQLFTLQSLYGNTVVLNFMFNGCSPVQTVGLRRVFLDHELDSKDKGIVFLSISIAPETDTPNQLKSFAQQYGIDAKNWRLGITDRASVDLLLDIFNAGKPVIDDPNAHLNTVFLISPNGHLEKVYTGFPITLSVVYADLSELIKDSSITLKQ